MLTIGLSVDTPVPWQRAGNPIAASKCLRNRHLRLRREPVILPGRKDPRPLGLPGRKDPRPLGCLKGAHLAFTGIFSKVRRELARAARRAGATIHGMPSIKTTVVVRGKPNALQAAGRDAGRKLMEIKRLREKGHRIVIISETQFRRLVAK